MSTNDKSKRESHPGSNTPEAAQGIELDDGRPFGQNGAWAPQGGQHLGIPERNSDGSPRPIPDESDHLGNTKSTTNSQ